MLIVKFLLPADVVGFFFQILTFLLVPKSLKFQTNVCYANLQKKLLNLVFQKSIKKPKLLLGPFFEYRKVFLDVKSFLLLKVFCFLNFFALILKNLPLNQIILFRLKKIFFL